MTQYCSDPSALEGLNWAFCYLTTGKHIAMYRSVAVVFALLAAVVPVALSIGFVGALMARSENRALRWIGKFYIGIVRGMPDLAFFLFFIIVIDQTLEWMRHRVMCPDWPEPVRQGNDFIVCASAKLPLSASPQWVHDLHGFTLAALTFSIVFGAFTANVLFGAFSSVPKSQLVAAEAFGFSRKQVFWHILVPQMWRFALPGLSNLWLILIKATPLLFLLGIQDIVYWARELGGARPPRFSDYPHGDWRAWYFFGLIVFYLSLTWISEKLFARVTKCADMGHATPGNSLKRGVR